MIKETIKYTDFNGNERSEDLYFHLSKADLIELQAKYRGGLKGFLERIVAEQDTEKVYALLTELIMMSCGKRSDDGSRFIKNEQIREEFKSSEAFSEIIMSFFTDVEKLTAFINGIIPHDLADQLAKMGQAPTPSPGISPDRPTEDPKDWNVFEGPGAATQSMKEPPSGALSDQPAGRVLTAVEIREMDPVDLQRGLVEGRYKLS